MYNIAELQNVKLHPVSVYFKNEYQNDWEYEYNKFMDKRKPTLKSVLRNAKSAIFSLFPNQSSDIEKRVSHCKTIAEVENVLKNHEREQNNQRFMLEKGVYNKLAS